MDQIEVVCFVEFGQGRESANCEGENIGWKKAVRSVHGLDIDIFGEFWANVGFGFVVRENPALDTSCIEFGDDIPCYVWNPTVSIECGRDGTDFHVESDSLMPVKKFLYLSVVVHRETTPYEKR
jgi:hypothetical protein